MSDQSQEQGPQKQQKIAIDLPKDLSAVYANVAFIRHTPAEMIIDFAQVLPGTPRGQILSRIIMSPMHAKMLQQALAQNIITFEQRYGEIRTPPHLADQFFRFHQPGSEPDQDQEGGS